MLVGEGELVVGLDEEVEVIVLDAGVDDAEVGAADAHGDGALDRRVGRGAAEASDLAHDAERDVYGMATRDVGPALVG